MAHAVSGCSDVLVASREMEPPLEAVEDSGGCEFVGVPLLPAPPLLLLPGWNMRVAFGAEALW
jgi:hypothetical protein